MNTTPKDQQQGSLPSKTEQNSPNPLTPIQENLHISENTSTSKQHSISDRKDYYASVAADQDSSVISLHTAAESDGDPYSLRQRKHDAHGQKASPAKKSRGQRKVKK